MDECQNVITFDDLDSIDIEDAKDDNMVNQKKNYTKLHSIQCYMISGRRASVGSPSCILIFGSSII